MALALWIVGVGVSFWAMSQEDDATEIWLDRSYFGLHRRSEGAFGDLEEELNAFGALSCGVTADLVWDHNWINDDEVRATLTLPPVRSGSEEGYWASYALEGFASRYTRKATERLAEGSDPAPGRSRSALGGDCARVDQQIANLCGAADVCLAAR